MIPPRKEAKSRGFDKPNREGACEPLAGPRPLLLFRHGLGDCLWCFRRTSVGRQHARKGERHDRGVEAQLVHFCVSLTSSEARKRRVAAHRGCEALAVVSASEITIPKPGKNARNTSGFGLICRMFERLLAAHGIHNYHLK